MAVDDEETTPLPTLPQELVESQILLRLPVKSLMRFRCVRKSWRNTISNDRSFAEAHACHHRRRPEMKPSCLLIAPYTRRDDADRDAVEEFATPGLWLWDEKQRDKGVANLIYRMPWVLAQRRQAIAHCNGFLMIADAEGTVRVLNPATGRTLTLPQSPNARHARRAFGFGRVLGNGAYKVAHFSHAAGRRRMEVFTIGGQANGWIETEPHPPYPFRLDQTAVFYKGSLIWTVDLEVVHFNREACFVRFELQNETFTIMNPPAWYPGMHDSKLAEIDDQLALVRLNSGRAEIWVCDDYSYGGHYSLDNPWWVQRYVIRFSSYIDPIAAFHDGIVFEDNSDNLNCDTSEGTKLIVHLPTLKYRGDTVISGLRFDGFDVLPYSPTLAAEVW